MSTAAQMRTIARQLLEMADHLEANGNTGAAKPRAAAKASGGAVADDAELDSPHGNPEIRKDPPRWDGDSYVGKHYSDCPAEYLQSLAGFLEWKAKKNEEDPAKAKYADYDRRDAKRARGWAARNANGPRIPSVDEVPLTRAEFGGTEEGDVSFDPGQVPF